MDNNLPPNNDNQKSDNLNINPPEPPVVPTPTPPEPTIPPMPEIPSTPPPPPPKPLKPEENINIPEPEQKPEEPKPEEKPIEIGSLGNPSSFTSYTQEETSNDSPKSANKGKKVKTIASVLGILLIITALPLTMLLVKQRQEIRKEAAGVESSGSANVCGVVLSASHSYSSGRLTTTFTIKNTRSDTASFEFHTYSCVCSGGNQKPCGTNSGKCSSTNDRITLAPGGSTSKTVSATQSGGDCGSFQNDGFIISVNGKSSCSNN